MLKTSFNYGWSVKEGLDDPFGVIFDPIAEGTPVTLPHDAMIAEKRDPDSISARQYGFYPAKSYTYLKTFQVPESWVGQNHFLEFEGVMQKAMVFLNGEFCAAHANGYTGFYVDLTPFLRYGENNTLKVVAVCEEKASRWYPGAGIYRDVWLWQGGQTYFLPEKQHVSVESLEEDYAVICLEGIIHNGGKARSLRLEAGIMEMDGKVAASSVSYIPLLAGKDGTWHTRITIDAPRLWSVDCPNLYRFFLKLYDGDVLADEFSDTCGIRTLRLDARKGLRINGGMVKLRGACIHHDNGIIGAATYYDAERFRAGKLKEAGFNAIRSAHNPLSKAMLRACDEAGLLVMDEFSDMWNEPKNCNDHAGQFGGTWEKDLEWMVDKDYNHPCVVLYSTGNEVPEIGRVSGADQNRRIAEAFRHLDRTRFTTFGMNGFLAVVDDVMQLSDTSKPLEERMEATAGSEGLNLLMGGTEQEMLDAFSVCDMLTKRIEPAASMVDVAGYNYLTTRHVLEHELHPDRVVMGSETYPPEIPRLWDIVKNNPHVIGDFTWTGYDYLGEAGIGIPHYGDKTGIQGTYPDRLAYCGDIDLNGTRRPMSYLREIVYGLTAGPFLAVERVEKYGQKSDKNSWKYADCVDSWTFSGYESMPARVRVLADCEEVELFLNGKSLGRKKPGETEAFTAFYELNYTPGQLLAVGYRDGCEVGRHSLKTAGTVQSLKVTANRETLPSDGQSLAFLTVDTLDAAGIWNRWEEKEIKISVEGEGTLLGFGSAAPSSEGSYQDNAWKTWDGRVMAVIRSTGQPGEIKIRFYADGCQEVVVMLQGTAC